MKSNLHTCSTCLHWHPEWSDPREAPGFGGCAATHNAPDISVIGNCGRWERLGWLETPARFACNRWRSKRTRARP